MCVQAFATDSGDESPWIYYRWLLGNSLAHFKQAQDAAAAAAGGSSGSSEAAEDAKAVLGEVSSELTAELLRHR
jgi:geranylgeranyl transferase type-2 subunit alpha